VRLLGPADLVRTRGRLHEPGKRSRLTEIAAWLVLHRGSDYASLTDAIWPEGTSTSNRNTTISKLRAWLGADDGGQPYLPLVSEHGSYTLADSVGCDWYHFQHLVRTGLSRGGAGARNLEQALELVRGAPMSPILTGRYGWAERVRQDISSAIVDATTALATHRLSASDWAGASEASRRGLAAAPGEERLYRLLFQALSRAGDRGALHQAIVELERYNESHGVEMDHETLELLATLAEAENGASREPQ
jgi:two-component SAPR family response regulator